MKKILLLLLLSSTTLAAWALSPEEKGLKIAQKADELDTGWGDQQQSLEMILRNKQGQESRRQIRGRSLEVIGDGDKAVKLEDGNSVDDVVSYHRNFIRVVLETSPGIVPKVDKTEGNETRLESERTGNEIDATDEELQEAWDDIDKF